MAPLSLLAGKKNTEVRVLPTLNHLFQSSETGAPSEYSRIEQTIAPEALETMRTWILAQVE